jgi:hypothetical protein
MIKRSNPRTPRVEEGAEIQTKGIQKLFNEIITENSQCLGKDMDSHPSRRGT